MCKYCEEKEDIIDNEMWSGMIDGNSIYIDYFGYYNDAIGITINFCPMCGKKLN